MNEKQLAAHKRRLTERGLTVAQFNDDLAVMMHAYGSGFRMAGALGLTKAAVIDVFEGKAPAGPTLLAGMYGGKGGKRREASNIKAWAPIAPAAVAKTLASMEAEVHKVENAALRAMIDEAQALKSRPAPVLAEPPAPAPLVLTHLGELFQAIAGIAWVEGKGEDASVAELRPMLAPEPEPEPAPRNVHDLFAVTAPGFGPGAATPIADQPVVDWRAEPLDALAARRATLVELVEAAQREIITIDAAIGIVTELAA